MSSVARVHTQDRNVNQLQENILGALNPIAKNPITNGIILASITLAVGANSVAHGLNRSPQGFVLVRQRAAATIYDTQDSNQTPTITLNLNSSAAVVVDIYVF